MSFLHLIIVGFLACGEKSNDSSTDTSSSEPESTDSADTNEPEAPPEPESQPEEPPEPESQPEGSGEPEPPPPEPTDEPATEPSGEDTSNPTGESKTWADVQPILQSNCASCHGWITDYSNVVDASVNNSSEIRVVPGAPGDSYLLCKIQGTACGQQMPKNASPLSSDDISAIEIWISEGALE